ncbi:patatin-like phospholipase family protein [Sphingobacterium sp. N143]|uniref:patatin-like phospholipase family protein n=1 Tax=Sphingobacterium sp. N143 TaxID=2746727 RepID=UPI002574A57A|nr:patatin-like phospholipase family protein [Sphingobacterium sp. N143]MDM1293167.1 patatin-like phospholipase family protein [Sphingobacterium sp. N143]
MQQVVFEYMPDKFFLNRKVTLVLGGGGARGLVHIGVIRKLEELGFEIDEIVGCSIGALIGGIYAQGKLDILEDWMQGLTKKSVFNMMDFSWRGLGMMKGIKVFNALKAVIPDANIETFPILFKAVATDLNYEKEVVLDFGSMYDAIRASIAIPAVFTAIEDDTHVYVDGGVLNPLPINHVTKKENIIVAVNLESKPDKQYSIIKKLDTKTSNSLDILQASYYVMRRKMSRMIIDLYQPDIVVDIPYNICNLWDYHRAEFLVQKGREYMDNAFKKKTHLK